MGYGFVLLGGVMEFLMFTIPLLALFGVWLSSRKDKKADFKRKASEKLKRVATRSRREKTFASKSAPANDQKIEVNIDSSSTQYPVVRH